jgi:ankyrin repeat protein
VDAVRPGRGDTAFHMACGCNQPECAEMLLRAGCDVGIRCHRYPMSLTSLDCRVSELVDSDTCPRPATQGQPR